MLINISEGFSEKREEIDALVGKPFTLEQRQKHEKTSITGLFITAASIDIYNLLVLNEGNSQCSIEMRPKGIIISFRVKNDTFSLIIPFYKLKIYKGKAEEYSFYKDHYFIKIWAGAAEAEIHAFLKKVRNFKADNAGPRVEDL